MQTNGATPVRTIPTGCIVFTERESTQNTCFASDASDKGSALVSVINQETIMKRIYVKAFNELKKMGVPVYVRDDMDGRFQISAEDEQSYKWADYYESPSSWAFGVNPKLDAVLSKHGLFSEWINPGELGVYQL